MMFGNDLSEETIDALEEVLHLTRDKILVTDGNRLRMEIEALYDMGRSNVFEGALNLSVLEEEVNLFSKIEDGYSKLMMDIELYLDKNDKTNK
jgi:hypothetical protein